MSPSNHSAFVPKITSEAGLTLTADNWEQAGIEIVSCSLLSLLMKPGYELLQKLDGLSQLIGWRGQIVLDASLPLTKDKQAFQFRSVYDGQTLRFFFDDVFALISSLKPDYVLLPGNFEEHIDLMQMISSTKMNVLLPASDAYENQKRYYSGDISYIQELASLNTGPEKRSELTSTKDLQPVVASASEAIQQFDVPIWIASLKLATTNDDALKSFIESDKPAHDGLRGLVYTRDGVLNISDETNEFDFKPIDDSCTCSTCSQDFTRAYLHHLYSQTPLLCQRLLIQHNIYITQAEIRQINF